MKKALLSLAMVLFLATQASSIVVDSSSRVYGTDGTDNYPVYVDSAGKARVLDSTDIGRSAVSYYANSAAAGTTTTETAITLTKSLATGATSTANSFVITSGKKFRITHVSVATRGHSSATAQTTLFSLRLNLSSAVTTTSEPVILAATSATPATALAWDRYSIPIPEGLEITGDGTLQFGVTAKATYTTNAPTWYVNIVGYEY